MALIRNTGVDELGRPLRVGSLDPHWRLVDGPNGPGPVYVLDNQIIHQYFGTMDSMWVWADRQGTAIPAKLYVFQTKFYLQGVDFTKYWVEIKGAWGADNWGALTRINGKFLPAGSGNGAIALPQGDIFSNYNQAHEFSISQPHFGSRAYVLDLKNDDSGNTLDVEVYNVGPASDNPAGFNMSGMRIYVNPVKDIPEPPRRPR